MDQESDAAAAAMNARIKDARAEAASFDAVAAEYGGGVTQSRQAAQIAFAIEQDLGTIARQRDATLSQLGQESRGASAATRTQLASLSRPTYTGTALQIASAGAGGYVNTLDTTTRANQRGKG